MILDHENACGRCARLPLRKCQYPFGLGKRAVDLVELIEDPILLINGDARPGVGYRDGEMAVARAGGDGHLARVGELDGSWKHLTIAVKGSSVLARISLICINVAAPRSSRKRDSYEWRRAWRKSLLPKNHLRRRKRALPAERCELVRRLQHRSDQWRGASNPSAPPSNANVSDRAGACSHGICRSIRRALPLSEGA